MSEQAVSAANTLNPLAWLLTLEERCLKASQAAEQPERSSTGIICQISGDDYVIPRDDVQEILECPAVTPVPGVPNWVQGLANSRGVLYMVIQLAAFLNPPRSSTNKPTRLIVLNLANEQVAFLADRVLGVVQFEYHSLDGGNGDFIHQVTLLPSRANGKALLLTDLIQRPEFQQLSQNALS